MYSGFQPMASPSSYGKSPSSYGKTPLFPPRLTVNPPRLTVKSAFFTVRRGGGFSNTLKVIFIQIIFLTLYKILIICILNDFYHQKEEILKFSTYIK